MCSQNLGCPSCLWSYMTEDGRLWCDNANMPAVERCEDFEYDPGTDEWERDGEAEE